MSICALTVAGALTGTVETALAPEPGCDLESILGDLQETVSTVCASRGEGSVAWEVPRMPSGEDVVLSFDGRAVSAEAAGTVRMLETWPPLHTWRWDGRPLDRTAVQDLDLGSTVLTALTGDEVTLTSHLVLVDDEEELLMFVG